MSNKTMGEVKVYEVPKRLLPKALISSVEFKSLNEKQQHNFAGRLQFIEQITLETGEWLSAEATDLKAFLERIELHLSINQGSPTDSQAHVSSWLVHTSWTFETSASKMHKELASKLISELDHPQPTLDCDLAEFDLWLEQQNVALKSALERFYGAETFDSAMAHLIAIDILLTNLLAGVSKLHLNPKVSSS